MNGHALIFDSGVGGLSVASEIRHRLPMLQQTYVADDEFRPYGERTDAELQSRLPELLWTLCEAANPDIAVIACNTASTSTLPSIRSALNVPVIGVVPAVKPAATLSLTGRFAVLGTPGTVRRKYVDQLISDFAPMHDVVLQGSTQLVRLAENKLAGLPVDMAVLKSEIAPLFAKNSGQKPIDTVVLACTHFPLLKDELMAVSPHAVNWIDSGVAIARRVETVLSELPKLHSAQQGSDVALLMGPNADARRAQAFQAYGFERVIGLMPDDIG